MHQTPPKIALALAGGGPLGAIYEIGALCALEESLQGLDFTRLDHYVGVSAGGFIVASLANGMTPRELCASFIENDTHASDVFDPSWLLEPAYGEFARRCTMLPRLFLTALWDVLLCKKSPMLALESLGPGLPTGLFSNRKIDTQLARLFSAEGRTNDFRQLKTKLTLVATHLDSTEPAPFGRPGLDHVPISKAVQASSALPGLFPPVEIDGQFYVDGVLKKTMHASVALEDGTDLLICLNPLVPFDAVSPHPQTHAPSLAHERRKIPRIADAGLGAVLSQTFRSLIHSRMELGMKQYERTYPGTDIILFEPSQNDPELYMANVFSYAQRRQLAEHAYQQTRQMLRARESQLSAPLARHGIVLNHAILDDLERHLSFPPRKDVQYPRARAALREIMTGLGDTVAKATRRQTVV